MGQIGDKFDWAAPKDGMGTCDYGGYVSRTSWDSLVIWEDMGMGISVGPDMGSGAHYNDSTVSAATRAQWPFHIQIYRVHTIES